MSKTTGRILAWLLAFAVIASNLSYGAVDAAAAELPGTAQSAEAQTEPEASELPAEEAAEMTENPLKPNGTTEDFTEEAAVLSNDKLPGAAATEEAEEVEENDENNGNDEIDEIEEIDAEEAAEGELLHAASPEIEAVGLIGDYSFIGLTSGAVGTEIPNASEFEDTKDLNATIYGAAADYTKDALFLGGGVIIQTVPG